MHTAYLQLAIQLATENVENSTGGPYGAVIVNNNTIIAATANQVTRAKDPTAHAEIMAIRTACRQLDDFQLQACTLYTSCEPCPMCLGAIYWARIAQVYYACNRHDAKNAGFDDSFIYDEIAVPPINRTIPMTNIPLQNANQPFIAWHNKLNKQLY